MMKQVKKVVVKKGKSKGGMHKMPDGSMMKDSDMKKMGKPKKGKMY